MHAIIEDSGTQIKVTSGVVIDIDLRDLGSKKTVTFDRVLLVGEDDGDATDGNAADPKPATIGTPYVAGAKVTADVLDEIKGEKIDVIKFKRRKGYRRKRGHRQTFLRVKIDEITGPSASKPKPKPRTTKKTTTKKDD